MADKTTTTLALKPSAPPAPPAPPEPSAITATKSAPATTKSQQMLQKLSDTTGIKNLKPLKDMMSLSDMKGTPKQLLLFVIVSTLSIIILILLFNKQTLGGTTTTETTSSVLFVVSFTFFLVIFCFSILPSLQEWRLLFSSMFWTSFVILFTLALTLVFTLVSKETLDTYAYIFAPISLIMAIGVFYKGLSNDYTLNLNNTMQEQIKTMIILSCFLVVMVISYSVDPGNYLHNTYNSNTIITITITFLTFMYLFVRFMITNATKNFKFEMPNTGKWGLFFNVLYGIFLIVSISGIAFTDDFMDDKPVSSSVISLLLVTTIIFATNFFITRTDSPGAGGENQLLKKFDLIFNNKLLFGIMMLLLGIWAIVSGVKHTNSISTIIFILMMGVVAFFIYKFYYTSLPVGNSQKAGFFTLIINIILYIPCLLFDLGKWLVVQYKKTTLVSLIVLLVTGIIAAAYLTLPMLFDRINLQGGNQLQNEPINTDNSHEISTYDKMNGIKDEDYEYKYYHNDASGNKNQDPVTLPTKPGFKYQYGLSFWVYLNAEPPNTNLSLIKDISLLNYGNKPNIRYNAHTHTFSVLVVNEYQETREEIIVYETKNFPLQKWNNIVINYLGGTMDIFLNGELVKSKISVVPYMSLDKLVVGEQDGIHGKVCNIVYFKQPLTASKMYYLYNMVNDKTPPVLNETNETIMTQNVNTVISSLATTN